MYGIAFQKTDKALCEKARDNLVDIVRPGGSWASIFQANLPRYVSAYPDYLTRIKPSADQVKANSCIQLG